MANFSKCLYLILVLCLTSSPAHSARVINSVLLDGSTTTVVEAGATVNVTIEVTTSGSGANGNWKSTSYTLDGTTVCEDTVERNGAGTYTNNFDITTPTDIENYDISFYAHRNGGCVPATDSNNYEVTDGVAIASEQCSDIFTDGMQNNDNGGVITFNYLGKITNSPDNILDSSNLIAGDAGFGNFSCDTGNCTSSSRIAAPMLVTDFGSGSDGEINLDQTTGSQTRSPGQYTSLTMAWHAELTLEAGDYFFTGDFFNDSDYDITISGGSDAVVRIFVQGNVTIGEDSGLNATGNSNQILLYSNGTVFLDNKSITSGFIYSKGNTSLDYQAVVNGAINARNITAVGNDITVNFPNSIPDICEVPSTELPQIPVHEYRFDELSYTGASDEVIDSIAAANAQAINSQPIEGKVCNAIDLSGDGDDDYVILAKEALDGKEDFTISLWAKTDNTDNQTFLSGNDYVATVDDPINTSDNELLMWFNDDTTFRPHIKDVSDSSNLITTPTLSDENWHHLVWTRQGDENCLYVDNVQSGCVTGLPTGALTIEGLILGQDQDSIGGGYNADQAFEGLIDELVIFDEVISERQIEYIYNNQDNGLGYDGEVRACPDEIELVAGRVTLNATTDTGSFTHVCFDETFSTIPLVFSMPTTADDSDRLTLRIKNVTTEGFDIAQVESRENANPSAPNGNPAQTVDFLAIVPGDYDLGANTTMRVNSISTQEYQRKPGSGQGWEYIDVSDLSFTNEPTIIASIQTMANEIADGPFPISEPFMATTIDDVTSAGFNIALERGETLTGSVGADETIGYIAITSGVQAQLTSDITIETYRTSNSIENLDECHNFNFNYDDGSGGGYTSNPLVIASQNTRDGVDGAWLKRCNISLTNVGLGLVEDADSDNEVHHTTERAGFIALGGTFDDFTNSCPIAIDHFEIDTLDETGITCAPDEIIIKACANASCSTVNADSIEVALQLNGAFYKTVTVSGSNGTTTSYANTTVGPAQLSLDQTYDCTNTVGTTPCEVEFADSGFLMSTIPTQLSGKPSNEGFNASTLTLQAVETDGNTGECVGIFPDNTDVAVNLSYTCDAGNCIEGDLELTNNSISYGLTTTATARDLLFSSNSTAEFSLSYPHAGRFILNAQKTIEVTDNDNNTVTKDFSTSSNAFVERPFGIKLDFSNDSNAGNWSSVNGSGTAFKKAGETFVLSATAMQWVSGQDLSGGAGGIPDGIPDDFTVFNQNTLVAENFNGGEITVERTLLLPISGNEPALNLISSNSFNTSTSTLNNQYSFDEVGIIELSSTLTSADYLGAGDVIGKVTNVGRFTPAFFTQTVEYEGSLRANHDTDGSDGIDCTVEDWAYAGQTLENGATTEGAISYDTGASPVINIHAYNVAGAITQNYTDDDFVKLTSNNIIIPAPTHDDSALRQGESLGGDTIEITTADMTIGDALTVASAGVLRYTFNDADNFVYEHTEESKVNKFTAQIPFVVTEVQDSDGIALYNSAVDPAITPEPVPTVKVVPTGVEIRFGRWLLDNSYGPETSRLPIDMTTEYFDGVSFVTNTNEICLIPTIGSEVATGAIDDAGMDLWDYRLADDDLSPSQTTPSLDASNPMFTLGLYQSLFFSAPGDGYRGEAEFEYQVPPWLQYDWNDDGNHNNNPTATLNFGVYRGNDRIIYQREIERVN